MMFDNILAYFYNKKNDRCHLFDRFYKFFYRKCEYMYKNTKKLLEIILKQEYDKKNPLQSLPQEDVLGQLYTVKKGEIIIQQKAKADHLYLLLSGTARVLTSTSWFNDQHIDTVEALDVLGMIEHLNDLPGYTAYVVAQTPCTIFKISTAVYISIIQEEAMLCYLSLRVLGRVTQISMNSAESNLIFQPRDIIGHYFYLQSREHRPYKCTLTRRELADELFLNLRTVYRHIQFFEEKEYLTIQRGKIYIYESHFEKLRQRYGDIIL